LGIVAPVENVVHVIWLKLHNWLFFDSRVKSKDFFSTREPSPVDFIEQVTGKVTSSTPERSPADFGSAGE